MEKMAAIRRSFIQQGLLSGTVLDDIKASMDDMSDGGSVESESDEEEDRGDDEADRGDDEADGHEDEADGDEDKPQCVNQLHDDDQQAVEGDQSSLDDRLSDVMPASCLRK